MPPIGVIRWGAFLAAFAPVEPAGLTPRITGELRHDAPDRRSGFREASDPMTCSDFLLCYTGFNDGDLSPEDSRRCADHLESCAACQRYNEVVIQGIDLFRTMPAEKPAEDFRARLQHSIYALSEERRRRRIPQGGSGTMPLVAVAVVVATVVLTPFLREPEAVVDLPPIVVQGPVVRGVPVPPDARLADVDPRLAAVDPGPAAVVAEPFEELDLWMRSNALLYQHSSLYSRYREPSLVRTGLR